MEKNNNDQMSKDWTLGELLETGIDDIISELPDVQTAEVPVCNTEVSAEELANQIERPEIAEECSQRKTNAKMKKPVRRSKKSGAETFLSYLHDVACLLAGLVMVFLLLFRVVVVSGTSMNSTLLDGDYLLVLSNTFYQNPQRGDIIVASKQSFDDGAPIVKRVIATEGEKVDIDFKSGIVYVNDVALDEPYTLTPTNEYEGITFPLVVDEGCLFVMGDNRNGSKDSRHPDIGLIDKREVLGKVFFLFFPGTNHDQQDRDYGRFGAVG